MLRSLCEDSIRFKKWQMSRYLPDNEGKKPQLAVGSEDGDMESVIWYLPSLDGSPGDQSSYSVTRTSYLNLTRDIMMQTLAAGPAGRNKYIIKVLRYIYKCGSKIIL